MIGLLDVDDYEAHVNYFGVEAVFSLVASILSVMRYSSIRSGSAKCRVQ